MSSLQSREGSSMYCFVASCMERAGMRKSREHCPGQLPLGTQPSLQVQKGTWQEIPMVHIYRCHGYPHSLVLSLYVTVDRREFLLDLSNRTHPLGPTFHCLLHGLCYWPQASTSQCRINNKECWSHLFHLLCIWWGRQNVVGAMVFIFFLALSLFLISILKFTLTVSSSFILICASFETMSKDSSFL